MLRARVLIENEENSVAFPLDDRVFLGEGLFETLKVENARPCFAELHWRRMSDSAQKLGIPFDLSYEHWCDHLFFKIKQDSLYQGGIKAILSGGSAPRGLVSQAQTSRLILQTFNYVVEVNPIRLISSLWLRDAANPIYQVKSVNYLEAILARRQAYAMGADDVLFFNSKHHATETTNANLFVIYKEQLFTPPLTDGVLPGITRARVLNLAQQKNIDCAEVSLTKVMLQEAEAVFITNSLQGIRPVSFLDDVIFPIEHPWLEQLTPLIN